MVRYADDRWYMFDLVSVWKNAIYNKLDSIIVAESLINEKYRFSIYDNCFTSSLKLVKKGMSNKFIRSVDILLEVSIYRNELDVLVIQITSVDNRIPVVSKFNKLEEAIKEIENWYKKGWKIDGKI